MNYMVTLTQLLSVGDTISDNSNTNIKVNQLLDEYVYSQYNTISIKQKLSLFPRL